MPKTQAPRAQHAPKSQTGFHFSRYFTSTKKDPLNSVLYERRESRITDSDGSAVFSMLDVEVPVSWSQLATDILASKYCRPTKSDASTRENSARQAVGRIARTVAKTAREQKVLDAAGAKALEDELSHLLINQMAAFNTPVWLNCGLAHEYGVKGHAGNWYWNPEKNKVEPTDDAYTHPQCSACFIQSSEDSLPAIFDLLKNEARIFKYGSGSGSNFSKIRSRYEKLSTGGSPSGLMFFLEVFDKGAGAIKSGGIARRAAKMACLDMDHPEIVDFIQWKQREEKKVAVMVAAGYASDFNGEAYRTVSGQNSNNSIRATDAFMDAVLKDGSWETTLRTTGKVFEKHSARKLMKIIAQAAWSCADPGVQFDSTINRYHTCPAGDRIRASNPCVTGDSLVSTAQGYAQIKDLVGKEIEIIAGDGATAWVSQVFKTGHKPVYELKTVSGYHLRLTGDHRVLTANRGDVPACELTMDDLVVLGGAGFGSQGLATSLAEVIGLAMGDGCISNQGYLIITMDRLKERGVLEAAQGAINARKANKFGSVHETPTTARVATCAPEIVELARCYAALNEGSENKRFTDAVFSLNKTSQAALLRGLFTSDGTVANHGDKSQYISLDSTSLTLLRQAQLMLLGFGIKGKLYENRRAGPLVSLLPDGKGGVKEYPVQQMHSLRISRTSRLVFQREIGFMAESEKAAKLAELNASVSAYADVLTDAVASLTPIGTEDVFDLTEPRTSHFVANGLVVHNCSEYMFLDDTACNLASLNLLKFLRDDNTFDVEAFRRAARAIFLAQEILVDFSSYPNERIAKNSHEYRPLGLGYANLGTLLMILGLPYDSPEARSWCGGVTALMTAEAYKTSAEIAALRGPFAGFKKNRSAMLSVMRLHQESVSHIEPGCPDYLRKAAAESWNKAVEFGERFGYRNAQATVLAPTGTIGLLMDCDTTGIEPDFALVKFKKLAGGGTIKIVNNSVERALKNLGYTEKQKTSILSHILKTGGVENAPELKAEHLPVFDCASPCEGGSRFIAPLGHVRMMAAAQPFISGAISKTVNLPHASTVQDIENIYIESWKLGVKAISVYRDGCKLSQPLTVSQGNKEEAAGQAKVTEAILERRYLPHKRAGHTYEAAISGQKIYVKTGEYPDGRLGEVFVDFQKPGSPMQEMLNCLSISVSLGLQYGVPLEDLVSRLTFTRFEPSGAVKHPNIKQATSIIDFIFRLLGLEYLGREDLAHVPLEKTKAPAAPKAAVKAQEPSPAAVSSDAPFCDGCGHITVRNGTCYKCLNCGNSLGCS